jgi:hypothetical protein
MVVPDTNCSQKKFEKFSGPKKGDLVPHKVQEKDSKKGRLSRY